MRGEEPFCAAEPRSVGPTRGVAAPLPLPAFRTVERGGGGTGHDGVTPPSPCRARRGGAGGPAHPGSRPLPPAPAVRSRTAWREPVTLMTLPVFLIRAAQT